MCPPPIQSPAEWAGLSPQAQILHYEDPADYRPGHLHQGLLRHLQQDVVGVVRGG